MYYIYQVALIQKEKFMKIVCKIGYHELNLQLTKNLMGNVKHERLCATSDPF